MFRGDDEDFVKWAKAVKVRDNFTCQICEVQGVYLEAHHKNAWNTFPEERYDLSNGVTLCGKIKGGKKRGCHDRFHDAFGYGGNTEFQFEQYEEIANTFKKIIKKAAKPSS